MQVGVDCTPAWFCCCAQSEGTAQLDQDAGQVRAVTGLSESGRQVRVPLVWVTTKQGARKDILRGRLGSAKPFLHSSEAVSLDCSLLSRQTGEPDFLGHSCLQCPKE